MKKSYWEKFYSERPLDQIPWQRTQADWFKHSVDSGAIAGKTSLDLGCGTGMKSIYLAQNGFKTVGIDISPSAINYAKKNANEAGVADKVDFYVGDILDLNFLGDLKFDFVLDWAALHCIERSEHRKYLQQILKHSKLGTLFMLRVFSSNDTAKSNFIDENQGAVSNVCVFQKDEIIELFGNDFEILEFKKSLPQRKDNLTFIEFLMKRKS